VFFFWRIKLSKEKMVVKCGGKWIDEDLANAVNKLCKDLEEAHFTNYPTLTNYKVYPTTGQKYIRIVTEDNQRTVWGFINIKDFLNNKGIKFSEGDVLKSAGWATPALNKPRGNLFMGYDVKSVHMRMYGPDYLI